MKSKKFNKKLSLNKNTVAHLSELEKKKVKGGCIETQTVSCVSGTCASDYIYCCIPETASCRHC